MAEPSGTPDPAIEPTDDASRPASPQRRKLLVTGAFAAATTVALGRMRHRAVAGPAGGPADVPNTTEPSSHQTATEPPALEGAAAQPPADHVYDIVIKGGRVIDPDSGFDRVVDVGIDKGTITGFGKAVGSGRKTIDATDKVVSPGFIDVLSYEPDTRGAWYKIADGVTTNLGMHGMQQGWWAPDFFTHYQGTTPVHFGGAFSDHWVRYHKLGLDVGATATASQAAQLADIFESQLRKGWLGIAFEPEYTPGVDFAEMLALAHVAQRHDVPCFIHGRFSSYAEESQTVPEIIKLGEQSGAAVHVAHLPSTGGTWDTAAALEAIDAAVEAGHDVTFCLYPYHYWGTYAASTRFGPGWQQRFRISYGDLQVAGTTNRLNASTFATAQARNSLTIAYAIPEKSVQLTLEHPRGLIGSDAIVDTGNNHPRSSGTFCRVLGYWVREKKVISLPQALAKMTILPARRLEKSCPQLRRKGRLQRGADADICIFDPDTVTDTATVANPVAYSTGIDWVLSAGVPAKTPDGLQRNHVVGQAIRSQFT
ncbi:MAG: amidohydrolase family protein [Actinobacteria bacterium]|nr:amidohydrolase family protein [Actinomycetota bacterium]